MAEVAAGTEQGRRLSWVGFAGVVVAYLAIIQGLGLLVGVPGDGGTARFPTAEAVVRNALIPIGVSILFAAGVTTWLGWWGAIFRYRVPVRPWVRFVPISMLIVALAALNYGHLADQEPGLIVAVLLLGVFVGFGEELMFRGIGVQVFRRAGLSEGKVALYSSAVFGLVHVSNAIGEGPQALAQAAIVSTSGYFFYLCLRVGGVILLPMLVHGLWDTSLFSSQAGPDPSAYLGIGLIIALQVILIVVLAAGRRRIDPEQVRN